MTERERARSVRRRRWPLLVLAAAVVPAVLGVTVAESGPDMEFPAVVRETYSRLPPSAYRLAEPGDTLDKIGLYAGAAGVLLGIAGWRTSLHAGRGHGAWPLALSVALVMSWHTATPWPTFDGWHGWNWAALFASGTPIAARAVLAVAALACAVWIGAWAWTLRGHTRALLDRAQRRGTRVLLVVAALGIGWRIIMLPDPEPRGYWPRWGLFWGLLALDLAMLRTWPARLGLRRGLVVALGVAGASALLAAGGRWVIWYHRPLERLRAVVPGKVYISAMPTYRGLEIAQRRIGFRTIINAFNEDSDQRSPRLPEELRFIREHGLRYEATPGDPLQADTFLDHTLALAQDPDAWPVLLHCHGCMDRSPAWMGIYRFLVEGRSLGDALREIEAHRGSRPKASVTLLYNRVLPPRAPERHAADPTARQLVVNAAGTVDPFYQEYQQAAERAAAAAAPSCGSATDNEPDMQP
jgi:hypothetical protein